MTGAVEELRPAGAAAAVLAGGALYFLAVFAVGFLLGVARTLWLVPRLGERWSELLEMPVMLVAIYLAARWISDRFTLRPRPVPVRLATGLVALALLLAAELALVLYLRSLTLTEYLETRDPVSGTAYALSLLIFAAMPALVSRRTDAGDS